MSDFKLTCDHVYTIQSFTSALIKPWELSKISARNMACLSMAKKCWPMTNLMTDPLSTDNGRWQICKGNAKHAQDARDIVARRRFQVGAALHGKNG